MSPAQALIERWGSPAISPLALTGQKTWFHRGEGAIAHVSGPGLRLALGEPMGSSEVRDKLLDAFLADAAEGDQHVAFVPVGPAALAAFEARGFFAVRVGREARLPLDGFTLKGTARKTVRQSGNRLRRLGYEVEVHDPPHTPAQLLRLESLSRAWIRRRPAGELRFGTGTFDGENLGTTPLAVAMDDTGRAMAFLSLFIPHPGVEAGIDLMRHHPEAPSGVMDFLIAETAIALRNRGLTHLNLGLAPLAGITSGSANTPEERILAFVRRWSPGYSFRGLEAFKAKFRPQWEDRYLVCTARAAILPALLVACELDPAGLVTRMGRETRSWLTTAKRSWSIPHASRLRDRRRKESTCWSIVSTRT